MKIFRTSVGLGAVAVALAAAGWPALGQDVPESLLPPGFNQAPSPTPTPRQARPAPAPTPTPVQATPVSGAPSPAALPGGEPTPGPTPTDTPTPLTAQELLKYSLPPSAKRSLNQAGFITRRNGGLPANAWGRSNGLFLAALMGEVDAPIASRWLEIGLRRALSSATLVPNRINGADFAAARATLLARLGEANAARAVVQAVDTDNYTRKLYRAALLAHLAAADPGGLCALQPTAVLVTDAPGWQLAAPMCAGLSGMPQKANDLFRDARRKNVAQGIDLRLAEKVMGLGAQGQRSVTVEWGGVGELNAWRYGLATATDTDIPDDVLADSPERVRLWRALAPQISASKRLPYARLAAARGVLSSAALVDDYASLDEDGDADSADSAIAHDLRTAYVAPTAAERIDTLKRLWAEPKSEDGKFARLVLTARASSGIPANQQNAADAERLIASMLTAGLDSAAMRWRNVVQRGSAGWALLTVADPGSIRPLDHGDIDAFRKNGGASDPLKARMLVAALAGLGRLRDGEVTSIAQSVDLTLGTTNRWTEAIDKAGQAREAGTVLLLAAIGMQTPSWKAVSPVALFHIVSALRAAGQEGYARMIAAEAVSRV
ncbi:hypothetical protein GCM10023219_12080 [Stakelama sediminis]|uniref:Uncharacterized protein n=1 Tax=Stakelama sediminis TaxID=463200 RepID=A0A840YWK2_9SPHN|nr:hypothetical protein [Stakelama sediminis]MBB5717932.1 hypothetical protein [Stakelama sediminis]